MRVEADPPSFAAQLDGLSRLLALVPEVERRVLYLGEQGEQFRARAGGPRRELVTLTPVKAERANLRARGPFEAILCDGALARLRQPVEMLKKLREALTPEGRLVLRAPNLRHMDVLQALVEGGQPQEPAGFTRRSLEVLLQEAGFAVTQVQGVPGPGHAEWQQVGGPGELRAGRMGISDLDPEEAEEFFFSEWVVSAQPAPEVDWGLTSVVMLTWNELPYTQRCLASLRRHTRLPIELIVVDNGSTDGTVAWLESQPDLHLIVNPSNLGFPKAANQGIAAAKGRQILLLNNDIVLTAGWLGRLLAHLHASPQVGMVGPCSNFVSGPQQVPVSYQNLVELESFAWRLGRSKRGQYRGTDRLVGFCLLIKRELLDRVGVLDEQFGLGCFEDDDLCRRATAAGYELRICDDAFVHHYGGRSFIGNQVPFSELMAGNQQRFLRKWGTTPAPLPAPTMSQPLALLGDRRPASSAQRRAGQPTISLCMIVRNEADKLRACLDSARPYVDEMIVVDTGSTDATAEIARACGATVIQSEWQDSFSAARNVSLAHATGEWIFWLDADDVLPPASGEALRRSVQEASTQVLGFVAQVHCPAGPGEEGETVVDHVKLFRNRPDLRFELRIHEQILPSIRRAGGEIARAPIHVHHAHYDHSPEGQARKRARDARLLALDLQEAPDHPFVHFNVGMTACHEHDYATAVHHLRQSIQLSHPSDSQVRKAYALLASAQRAQGQPAAARATCEEGLGHYPRDGELLFNLALAYQQAGDLGEAEASFQQLLSLPERGDHLASIDTGIFSYKARHNLAVVLQGMGKLAEAEAAWQQALAEQPEFLPGWLALGDLLLDQQRQEEFAQLARRAQRVDGAMGALLLARAALRQGEPVQAESHLRAALEKRPDLVEGWRLLSHVLLRRGERQEVESVLRRLVALTPGDGEALHNLGTLLVETGRAQEAIAHLQQAVALRPEYPPSQELLQAAMAKAGAGN